MIFALFRKLFHGTKFQETQIFGLLYRLYVRFLQKGLRREEELVFVPFRGLTFAIERGDITILPTLVKGTYESAEINLVLNQISQSTTFIDVGANIGVYSALLARSPLVDRVICIEPNPRTVSVLKSNLTQLDEVVRQKCEVLEVAISNTVGSANFLFSKYHGTGRLSSSSELSFDITVPVQTLDLLSDKYAFANPVMLKIDVEGFEPNVILGARRFLVTHKPDILVEVCRSNSDRVGTTWNEAIRLLSENYPHATVIGSSGTFSGDSDVILKGALRDGRLHNCFFSA